MNPMRWTSAILYTMLMTSCSDYTVDGDYDDYRTVDIVKHIRCEAQRAIEAEFWIRIDSITIPNLKKQNNSYNKIPLEMIALAAIDMYNKNIVDDEKRKEAKTALEYIFLYLNSGVSFDFDLKAASTNYAAASASIQDFLGAGALILGADTSEKQISDHQTKFKFAEVFSDIKSAKCSEYNKYTEGSRIYPITGDIGIKYIIGDFYDLYAQGNLKTNNSDGISQEEAKLARLIYPIIEAPLESRGQQKASTTTKETPKSDKDDTSSKDRMSRVFKFSTERSGGLGPSWNNKTKSEAFHIVSVTGSLNRQRVDVHSVTVGVSLPVLNVETNTVGKTKIAVDAKATSANAARATEDSKRDTLIRSLERLSQ